MSRLGLANLSLALLLLILGAAHLIIPSDPTQRNYQFFPNMVDALAHEAQAPVPMLAEGRRIDLRPPEGSIAKGHLPSHYGPTPEDALRAGRELHNPVASDDAGALKRGAFLFSTFCTPCHGPGMHGDGLVTKRGVPPPPSLFLPHALDLADGQIWHIISYGQGNMAPYAAQVEREDRWKLVAYIRQAQASTSREAQAPAQNPFGTRAQTTPQTHEQAGTVEESGS